MIRNQSSDDVLSAWKISTEYDSDVFRAENGEYNVSNFNLVDCLTSVGHLEVLHSTEPFVSLGNGTDNHILIYPSFVLITNQNDGEIVTPDDLEVEISRVCIVSDSNPKDVNVIDFGWKYAKKDGGKDLRYKDNKKMYVLDLFKLEICTKLNYKVAFLFGREDIVNFFAAVLKQQVKMSLLSSENTDIESDSKKE